MNLLRLLHSGRPGRRLAALLLATWLHALVMPVAVAMPVAAAAGDCDDCHILVGAPCLMSPGSQGTGDGDVAAARNRPQTANPAMQPVLVLPPVPVAPAATSALLLCSGAAASGRPTGDPPRHLCLGRLHI